MTGRGGRLEEGEGPDTRAPRVGEGDGGLCCAERAGEAAAMVVHLVLRSRGLGGEDR